MGDREPRASKTARCGTPQTVASTSRLDTRDRVVEGVRNPDPALADGERLRPVPDAYRPPYDGACVRVDARDRVVLVVRNPDPALADGERLRPGPDAYRPPYDAARVRVDARDGAVVVV